MVALYADENVDFNLVDALQKLGLDVMTALEDGRANQRIDDPHVLTRARDLGRVILTNNRKDYHRLHRLDPNHQGIITYTDDPDLAALAARIGAAASSQSSLAGILIRVVRPNPSRPRKPTP